MAGGFFVTKTHAIAQENVRVDMLCSDTDRMDGMKEVKEEGKEIRKEME
jgi:hypothetical protein